MMTRRFGLVLAFLMVALPIWTAPAAAESNPTLETIHQRKSVRTYVNKPVSREQVEVLLKAGMAAPTAADKRPWAFVATTDRAVMRKLAQAMPYGKMLETAGAAIVVCGIPSKSLPGVESQFWIQDCSAASENILLAAESLGLGAVWIGVYPLESRAQLVRQTLNIPAHTVPLNIISIGYPTGGEKPKNKYNPAAIHWDTW